MNAPRSLSPNTPLLLLLLAATASGCVEELPSDEGSDGTLTAVSSNLETPETEGTSEERAEQRDDDTAATEGDVRSDVAGASPFYNGYLCSGELVLFGSYDSSEDAAATCSATDLGNPQLGGLRCFVGEELVYDGCAADGSAAPEALLGRYSADFCDGVSFITTESITRDEAIENCAINFAENPGRGIHCVWNDEVLANRCEGAEAPAEGTPPTDSACYLDCRAQANAVIEACRSYGYGDDLCLASGQAQLDGCLSFSCGEGSYLPASGDGGGEPGPAPASDSAEGGLYRGFRCDNSPFIETAGISRDEALANCQLNAESIPGGVFCTFNDELLFENCPVTVGYTGPAEAVPGPAACEGWEQTPIDRVPDAIDTTYWNADAMNCAGPSFRRFDARYNLWVGLVSCGDAGYRFFLSETAEGPYLPATDSSGHGQDFCELIDPSFRIELGDVITSGGCTECSIGFNYSFVSGEVFVRGFYGERFVRTEAISWGPYQSSVIRCATGPLDCPVTTRPL